MARIRLGINNCFAVKRWPEPQAWAEIVAVELGLKVVQFSYDLLDPRAKEPARSALIADILDACRGYGLEIDSTFTGLAAYNFNMLMHPNPLMRADALDWYANAIEVAAKLDAKGTGGHIAALSWRDYLDKDRRDEMIGQLIDEIEALSSLAKLYGLKVILWEPMPIAREPPHTIEEARELLGKTNKRAKVPVKLCIDLGHACAWDLKEGSRDRDPYAWLRELASQSPVIHVQQTDGRADRHWPFTKEYNARGIIKPEEVIKAIDDSGAQEVLLALEIIHPFEAREDEVLRDLKESVRYWKEYVG